MSRAVVMRATGPPEVLWVEEVSLPELRSSEVRIRTIAAVVNHSDLEIRAGAWPVRREPPFPYVPGLEVVANVGQIPARSLDAVMDTVAGSLFEPLVGALRDGGGLGVVGAMGGDRVTFSAWELVRGVTLTGYTSESLDGPALRRATGEIFDLLRAGRLEPPAWQTFPLEQAAEAHRVLERGGVEGRLLLVP